MQLFVLGMHRSGTSSVTRILNMAGAYFAPEGMSNGADAGNPKGFWERLDVRAECDALLHASGSDWWRLSRFSLDDLPADVRDHHVARLRNIVLELDAHRPWVVKEPRLCLLFPLLRPLLEVPVCIHVTREPLEVAESLHKRNGFPSPAGLALWELYTLRAFEASAGLPRLLVRYEDLMAAPVDTVRRFAGQLGDLGVEGLRVPTDREITAFISPDLHRSRRSSASRNAWLNESQARLAAAIDDASVLDRSLDQQVSDGALAQLRALEDDHVRRERIAQLEQDVVDLHTKVDDLSTRTDELEEEARTTVRRAAGLELDLRSATSRQLRADATLRTVEHEARALARSRAWRLAWGAISVRRILSGGGRRRTGPLDRVIRDIDRSRRELQGGTSDGEDPPPAGHLRDDAATTRSEASPHRTRLARPKVAVLAWDVGHNPLGRAHVLAGVLSRRSDVEIWGAQFERYGSQVWAPLREADIPLHVFDGRNFPQHLGVMADIAGQIDADAIWVSKPRLPSFGLGVLAKEARNRPLVLDVDDDELAFFDEHDGLDPGAVLRMRGEADLALPFGRAWTRACQPLVGAVDQVTVSNVAIQDRFGGVIVPHARDETVFDPALYDRDETRRRLGVTASDRLLLFGGTPRVHKGVVEILRALERLGDERYRVLLFGTRELGQLRAEIGPLEHWVLALPYQRFSDLPRLVGAADLACVLQDPNHPVSRYQLPAKVTDALAMAVPCLVRPLPPMRALVDNDVLQVYDDAEPLHERIASIFEHYDDAVDRAAQGRKLFEEAYSYEAVSEVVAPMFDQLSADPPPLSPRLRTLIDLPRQVFAAEDAEPPRRVPGRRRTTISQAERYDIVMFWKQNDTGIYGRRQDMFVKYLSRSPRVGSIVHFDRPTTPEDLYRAYRGARDQADQSKLVVRQTVGRLLRRRDTEKTHFHTFLYGDRMTRRLGLPKRTEFPAYVKSVLARRGIGSRPTIFWVYPTHYDLPGVIDALDPEIVVADVVDDHRTFCSRDSPLYDRFERNYAEVLARSDVVLANCEPVGQAMLQFAPEVHVVPNGLELHPDATPGRRPRELRGISGPIIGYVGNLSQRLDIPLLEDLVAAHPTWQFVFVGSAHFDRSVLRLEQSANVHFVGVKPYDETLRFIRHFDVALIPHIDNEMTRSMNPLKAYVYCSTGVPVVSTPVANLESLADLITVVHDPKEFGAAIERALRAGPRTPDHALLAPLAWEARIEQAIELIDQAVAATAVP